MSNDDASKQEILQAINTFADRVEDRFGKIDNRFDKLESGMSTMKSEMSAVRSDMSTMRSEMSTMGSEMSTMRSEMSTMQADILDIQTNMVTTEYLDNKLMDLKSDLVILMRKEDYKLNALVDMLFKKKIISENDKQHLLSLEPFPKSV